MTVDLGSFSPGGNGTFNTSTMENRPQPPSSKESSGLDDSFDQHLDDSYGPSISLTDTRQWGGLLPDVSTAGFENNTGLVDGFPVRIDHRRYLQKRWFGESVFRKIGNVFTEKARRCIPRMRRVTDIEARYLSRSHSYQPWSNPLLIERLKSLRRLLGLLRRIWATSLLTTRAWTRTSPSTNTLRTSTHLEVAHIQSMAEIILKVRGEASS